MPAGWTAADIGAPAIAGTTQYTQRDLYGGGGGGRHGTRPDQFRYAYSAFTGDINIISRVASLENTHPLAKAGVMIRETLAANAVHTSLTVTPGNGTRFYRRPTMGGITLSTPVGTAAAPHWVRLERRGSTVTGYQSSDGVTWTSVGTRRWRARRCMSGWQSRVTITARPPPRLRQRRRSDAVPGNQAPTVALTAPANGATFTAPASVTMTATPPTPTGRSRGSSSTGTGRWSASDTTSPYSVTWTNAPRAPTR